MKFIYEDIAKKLLTSDRVLKYKTWVEEAKKARNAGSLSAKENQYDKAEELITFYTFAPLDHENVPNEVKNHVVEGILSFVGINEPVREVKIHFEKDLPPPDYYLKWLSGKVKEHLIGYIRREAETKMILEGPTQVDAIVETDNLLILIEVKFTSDISPYTKFGLIRNQIARLIDAGIEEAVAHHKRLVVLLCTPSNLFQRRSRLYYYKIQEYSTPSKIQKDIPWRTTEEINATLEKATWASLETIIKAVYHNVKGYLNTEEFAEAERFCRERMLWFSV
jgi:hypothetical protein